MRKERSSDKIEYIKKLYAVEDSLLMDISDSIRREDYAIHIGAEEGKLLQVLIKLANINNIVEIGTHFAYSTIWMARALTSNGNIITLEKDIVRAKKAKENIIKAHCKCAVELRVGCALESLERLTGSYDMVFIDANKTAYPKYLDWALKHIRPGGIVVADNTLLSEAVYNNDYDGKFGKAAIKAMQEFNLKISNENDFCSILLPTEEGITIAVKL